MKLLIKFVLGTTLVVGAALLLESWSTTAEQELFRPAVLPWEKAEIITSRLTQSSLGGAGRFHLDGCRLIKEIRHRPDPKTPAECPFESSWYYMREVYNLSEIDLSKTRRRFDKKERILGGRRVLAMQYNREFKEKYKRWEREYRQKTSKAAELASEITERNSIARQHLSESLNSEAMKDIGEVRFCTGHIGADFGGGSPTLFLNVETANETFEHLADFISTQCSN